MKCEPLLRLLKDPYIRVISVVGGGGKSGLILWISRLALKHSVNLIISTTTKMRFGEVEAMGHIVYEKDLDISSLPKELNKKKLLVLFKDCLGEKVLGVESALVDSLKEVFAGYKIIVEADGSKGMPIKANLEYEPVVPPSTDVTIGVIGLDALNKPLKEVVFRQEEFKRYYGLEKGQLIDWDVIVRHVNSPKGLFKGVPSISKKILFFNKADLLKREEQEALVQRIRTLGFQVEEIFLGSVLNKELISLRGENENTLG